MSSTITARLADMDTAVTLYDSIYNDLEVVYKALGNITDMSASMWNGDAANVFKNNMVTLIKQVQDVSANLFACKMSLVATINAYKALENENTSSVESASNGFAMPAY